MKQLPNEAYLHPCKNAMHTMFVRLRHFLNMLLEVLVSMTSILEYTKITSKLDLNRLIGDLSSQILMVMAVMSSFIGRQDMWVFQRNVVIFMNIIIGAVAPL